MTSRIQIKDSIIPDITITVHDRIGIIQVPDQYALGMLFLRYQEYYESPNKTFNRKPFKILDFMNWYRKETKSKSFKYPEDYIGYNIPITHIMTCYGCIPDGDFNDYDRIMYALIISLLAENVKYVIGVPNTIKDKVDATFKHEIAHALWYTDAFYRKDMEELLKTITSTQYKALTNVLKEEMYGPDHYADEIHAYLSTGLHGTMRKISGIKTLEKQFRKQFNRYYKPFTKNILEKTAPLKRQKK
jgi:hypothetical protein